MGKTEKWRARTWTGAVVSRTLRSVLLALASAMLLSGCSVIGIAASVEAGPELFYYGKLEQVLRAPLPEVHEASVRVIREMVSELIEERADSRSAHLSSKSPDGEPLWVDLEALGEEQTRITIRAGLSGDEDRERYILTRIKKRLEGR